MCYINCFLTYLRKAVLVVCIQEPTLFSTTIAENIRYGSVDGSSVTDDQVWQAARMANAEVFIRQFPNALNTLVGERGIMLSGASWDCYLNRPHYGSCPSVCLSVRPSVLYCLSAQLWGIVKQKFVGTFFAAGVTNVPVFSSEGQRSLLGSWLRSAVGKTGGWPHVMSALGQRFHLSMSVSY